VEVAVVLEQETAQQAQVVLVVAVQAAQVRQHLEPPTQVEEAGERK
jgi:hypothetical protein